MRAARSLKGGLELGAELEETDILELRRLMSETAEVDILAVNDNLLRSLRNYLRPFDRQRDKRDIGHVSQHLDQAGLDANVEGEAERDGGHRGRRGASGRGGRGDHQDLRNLRR